MDPNAPNHEVITFPQPLSGKFNRSFAYATIKDRHPHILTKVIDSCHRHSSMIKEKHGEEALFDAKEVIGKLSKLRNGLMTDKPFEEIKDTFIDADYWNYKQADYLKENEKSPSWYSADWLYEECYLYRFIYSILIQSKYYPEFDPFRALKMKSLNDAISAVQSLAKYYNNLSEQNCDQESTFRDFLQISLWGNKCDLSLHPDGASPHESGPKDNIEALQPCILDDTSKLIWEKIRSIKSRKEGRVRIDIVLDNSGYELYTDLILADFLLQFGIADQVYFHPKTMPWFVSDVTPPDFYLVIDKLTEFDGAVADLAQKWKGRLEAGSFVLVSDKRLISFWTYAEAYSQMKCLAPNLYEFLSSSDLIIFKGDLNYRKLVGDLNWSSETSFIHSLQGFTPSSLCTLRTLKADVVVGLRPGQSVKTAAVDTDWMLTGKYAVIQSYISNES